MAEKGKDEAKEAIAEGSINPKYLKGLTYSDAEPRETEENGIKKTKMVPRTQPAQPEHVLAWREAGAEIVIVMKDGRKHRVKK